MSFNRARPASGPIAAFIASLRSEEEADWEPGLAITADCPPTTLQLHTQHLGAYLIFDDGHPGHMAPRAQCVGHHE